MGSSLATVKSATRPSTMKEALVSPGRGSFAQQINSPLELLF